MRESKFRIYDEVTEKMIYYSEEETIRIDLHSNIIDSGGIRNYRMKLMEWTGLQDKELLK